MVRRGEDLANALAVDDAQTNIITLYRRLLARDPTSSELELGQTFVENCNDVDAWQQYAQVLLASNEMMFID